MGIGAIATPENTISFLIIIGFTAFFHVKWSRKAVSVGPALLTTVGILFCFLGIALGLLDFDATDIKGSVPQLLNGIRTAFWSSVAGILGALTIKARHVLTGLPPLSQSEMTGANVSDLMEQLVRLNRSIAGNDDSTLINQIKLSRVDSNEGLSKLQSSFDNFVKIMAEANSKALIEALQKIVSDFNRELREQFGENFKRLDAAVEKLVVWQDQYKQQLEEMIAAEISTRDSMKVAAEGFKVIVENSQSFSKTATDLGGLLVVLSSQKDVLTSQLVLLADVVKDVSGKLPLIEPQIIRLVDQVVSGVDGAQKQLTDIYAKISQTAVENDQVYRKLLREQIEATHKELGSTVRQLTEDAKQNVVLLDKALEAELTKSIESLGKQLTALSRKFVEDYTPLTDQLKRMVDEFARR